MVESLAGGVRGEGWGVWGGREAGAYTECSTDSIITMIILHRADSDIYYAPHPTPSHYAYFDLFLSFSVSP